MFYRKSHDWKQNLDILLLSIIALHLSLIVSYYIHIDHSLVYKSVRYLNISVIVTLGAILSAIVLRLFDSFKEKCFSQNFWSIVKQVVVVDTMAVFYFFGTQKGIDYSRIVFAIYFPSFYLFFSVLLFATYKKLYQRYVHKAVPKTSLLIITTSNLISSLEKEFLSGALGNYQVLGVLLLEHSNNTLNSQEKFNKFRGNIEIVTLDNYLEFANKQWIEEVLVVTDILSPKLSKVLEDLTFYGSTVHFALTNSFYQRNTKQFTSSIGPYMAITTTLNYMDYDQIFLKRILDICGALVGCFIACLIAIIAGPIIYYLSPGPIIFKQKRVGRHGKVFNLYKFRTMYLDAEERKKELMLQNMVEDGLMFKMEFDPRIIGNKILPNGKHKEGFGALLRKLSLDEFPQFFNVLKGDMSLVGTRPPTLDEWDKYKLYHKSRLFIKPGITGLWQVSGRSTITNFKDVMKLDRKYITEWSFWSDIVIILKTIKVVLQHKDSY